MERKLKSLKAQRTSFVGKIDLLLEFANNLSDEAILEGVQARLISMRETLREFKEVERDLITTNPHEPLEINGVEEKCFDIEAKLGLWLRMKSTESSMNFTMSQNDASHMCHNGAQELKLPKSSVPIFSGDYSEWHTFYDLYCANIHDRPGLTPSQKFQFLCGYLRGEASNLIKHLRITDANYKEAIQKLRERYSRKKQIVNSFVGTFLDQPTIGVPSAGSIRKLLDTSDEILRGIRAIGTEAEKRDPWIIRIILNKLDNDTKSKWMEQTREEEFPTIKTLLEFLQNRVDDLENIQSVQSVKRVNQHSKPTIRGHVVSKAEVCPVCAQQDHVLYKCPTFNGWSVAERRKKIQSERLCYNCFKSNHGVVRCTSKIRCSSCGRKHNTLLHEEVANGPKSIQSNVANEDVQSTEEVAKDKIVMGVEVSQGYNQVVLPTAIVYISSNGGHVIGFCRALLDCGSQASFVCESLVQRCKLKVKQKAIPVAGLSDTAVGKTRGSVLIKLLNSKYDSVTSVEAYVLGKVTVPLPQRAFTTEQMRQFINLNLADPGFNIPGTIEMLLGADQFFTIILDGQIRSDENLMFAQHTKFGWVISGQLPQSVSLPAFVGISTMESIDSSLKRFWELERVPTKAHLTLEEEICEEHYRTNVTRNNEGRFVVRIPFKTTPMNLGDNTYEAIRRSRSVESRFAKDHEFQRQYKQFMADYVKLGHMRKISSNEIGHAGSYFMPHHGVLRQSNKGLKLRVVFDASSKSSTGYSLNDVMRKGPVVQSTLYSILLRFRVHQFVITADVEKIYCQIQVADEDAKWQKIVWRDDCTNQVDYYQLLTVTYGTTSAPYLATRTLKEIAMMSRTQYPKAAKVIERDTYVDDIMTGCKTVSELAKIRDNLVKIFSGHKMKLKKWISNSPTILDGLPQSDVDVSLKKIEESADNVKVLGLQWDPVHDKFVFKVRLDELGRATKRDILSEISRVFDPLGLVSPCIVQVKMLLQLLWKAKVEWDEELPITFKHQWLNMRDQLQLIEAIEIPRWIQTTTQAEIHGFCEASSHAYGACIYVKVTNSEGRDEVSLYTSKSKVAPTNPLTIPRLELCAAVLLSRLMKEVQDEIGVEIKSIYAWTDSTVVFSWLSNYPVKGDIFVNNRLSVILELYTRNYWNHVAGNENPADLVSRGATPTQLKQSNLWWHGPQWLHNPSNDWPIQSLIHPKNGKSEEAVKCLVTFSVRNDVIIQLEERVSSFFKIVKVLAAVLKFSEVIRTPKHLRNPTITSTDVIRAEIEICKKVQGESFTTEIKDLSNEREIGKSSSLLSLNPFIDVHGVLRVGGRLSRVAIDYNIKHPIILPSKSLLVRKMVEESHVKYHHAGATLLLSILKQRFWIVGARRLVRQVVRKCVQCFKSKPISEQQQMADLPHARVQFVRPFLKVGVDYAGPFNITPIRRRGQRTMKNYVCIFICLATRAIHIELVFNLTTEDFLAALKRMTSRRGLCSDIYSDCGSNFVGANKELCHLYKFLCSYNNDLRNYLLKDKINWHFNPPGAPHFGGIWEAAVKSMKVHLKRVLGNTIPTIDEFNTLLIEIEGLLNSRPLCRSTAGDIDCLTPAHFLIGHPLTTIPDANLCEDRKISYQKRWQMIQQLSQNVWTRWHREYLVTLQERTKWNRRKPNLVIGDIVIIKDDSILAKRWVLGKVIELYEGNDGLVRIAKIKTQVGEVKRPVQKLCKLPIGEPEDPRGAGCLRLDKNSTV